VIAQPSAAAVGAAASEEAVDLVAEAPVEAEPLAVEARVVAPQVAWRAAQRVVPPAAVST